MRSDYQQASLVPAQGEQDGVPYKTIDEAAAVLRKGPRWLASWLKAHPVDRHASRSITWPVARSYSPTTTSTVFA